MRHITTHGLPVTCTTTYDTHSLQRCQWPSETTTTSTTRCHTTRTTYDHQHQCTIYTHAGSMSPHHISTSESMIHPQLAATMSPHCHVTTTPLYVQLDVLSMCPPTTTFEQATRWVGMTMLQQLKRYVVYLTYYWSTNCQFATYNLLTGTMAMNGVEHRRGRRWGEGLET